MRLASTLISMALLQGSAFAQTTQAPGPEIEVVDGKVSMSALGVPLSRIVSMLDRAMGLKSKVAPELASRNISVKFTGLPLKDAVHKIFEGQPLNYSLIEGKGLDVSGVAQGGGTTSTVSNSPFSDSGPISQPISNSPLQPLQPVGAPPVNAAGQPVTGNAIFPATGVPNPSAVPATTNTTTPGAVAPGQMPPPIGANSNPLNPVGGQTVQPAPITGFPSTPAPAPQPSGPGTVGGAAPATPGTIR